LGFFIAFYLRLAGAAQTDNAHCHAGSIEDQCVDTAPDIAEREEASFALAVGAHDQRGGLVEFGNENEGQSPVLYVLRILRRIELNLQDLIVYINKKKAGMRRPIAGGSGWAFC
jgi:hypothetical protein